MIENEDFKVDFQSLEETDLDTLVPGPAELIVNTGGEYFYHCLVLGYT